MFNLGHFLFVVTRAISAPLTRAGLDYGEARSFSPSKRPPFPVLVSVSVLDSAASQLSLIN